MYALLNFKVGVSRTDTMRDICNVIAGTTDINLLSSALDKTTSSIAGSPGMVWTISGANGRVMAGEVMATDFVHESVDKPGKRVGLRFKWADSTNQYIVCPWTFYNLGADNNPEFYAYPATATTFANTSTTLLNATTADDTRFVAGYGTPGTVALQAIIVNTTKGLWISTRLTNSTVWGGFGIETIDFMHQGHTQDSESIPLFAVNANTISASFTKVRNLVNNTYQQETNGTNPNSVTRRVTIGSSDPFSDVALSQGFISSDAAGNPRMPAVPAFIYGNNISSTALGGLIGSVTSKCGAQFINSYGGAFSPGQTITVGGKQYIAMWRVNGNANINYIVPAE